MMTSSRMVMQQKNPFLDENPLGRVGQGCATMRKPLPTTPAGTFPDS
jgi:hypothetical protein